VVAARLLLRRWCVVGVWHRPVVLHGRVTYVMVSEIEKILSRIEIDMPTTFCRAMSLIITYCAGCVHMPDKPIQYVHLNPFHV